MKINDVLELAWRNLMRRKSRTILTILSVVIGIFSIILMLSFGFGIQKQQESLIQSLGGLTAIQVYPTQYIDQDNTSRLPTTGVITDKVIEEIKRNPKVKNVFAVSSVNANIRTNKKNTEIWSRLSTINLENLKKENIKLADGSELPDLKDDEFLVSNEFYVFTSEGKGENQDYIPDYDFDFDKEKIFFVIGYKPEGNDMIDINNPKKQYQEFKGKFKGRIAKTEYIPSNTIIVSEKTAQKYNEIFNKLMQDDSEGIPNNRPNKKKTKVYENASVFVHDMNDVKEVIEDIKAMDLEANSDLDFIEAERERTRMIQLVLGGIGSIALIVAAIGISNTMLMSIQERTKEIGVMKVIGAQIKDIRKMFLFEAILIGIIGGIIGVVLSIGASEIANNLVRGAGDMAGDQFIQDQMEGAWKGISYIPFWLPFIAVIFSGLVGLLAGYLPAHRATKLSAIEAIRTN